MLGICLFLPLILSTFVPCVSTLFWGACTRRAVPSSGVLTSVLLRGALLYVRLCTRYGNRV